MERFCDSKNERDLPGRLPALEARPQASRLQRADGRAGQRSAATASGKQRLPIPTWAGSTGGRIAPGTVIGNKAV